MYSHWAESRLQFQILLFSTSSNLIAESTYITMWHPTGVALTALLMRHHQPSFQAALLLFVVWISGSSRPSWKAHRTLPWFWHVENVFLWLFLCTYLSKFMWAVEVGRTNRSDYVSFWSIKRLPCWLTTVCQFWFLHQGVALLPGYTLQCYLGGN